MNTMKTQIISITKGWLSGFIDGEGTFFVGIFKNSTIAQGYQVQLTFSITQHSRDKILIESIINYIQVGHVVQDGPYKYQFRIRSFADFEKSLFPLLDESPLLTQKRHDAEDFRKVYNLIKENKHLTSEGLEEIRNIKKGINRGRINKLKKSFK